MSEQPTAEVATRRKRIQEEVPRRRTFAIISHPDAGKTTLTEKLLLYGGAIHLAGSVKQRRASRHAISDWMDLEKERGISVQTSVMQFEYSDRAFNLLDTPGHNDFAEDTYRTLTAADCAVMLVDIAKGVEPQTIKLFEVCRMRQIPIVTFVNKLDRQGLEPFELLDNIETVLGIPTCPVTWPVGQGRSFQGVYDRWSGNFMRFQRGGDAGQNKVEAQVSTVEDPALRNLLGQDAHQGLVDEVALLDEAGNPWDPEAFATGQLTPVFFGSAMTNFGVEPFLDRFGELAPPPAGRESNEGHIAATAESFSAFIFKIQANMDPRHRDRIAFMRICSGHFQKGMEVHHVRTGRKLAMSRPLVFQAKERIAVEEAFAGDIIGVWDPGVLAIGDTLSDTKKLAFEGMPRFSPEHFVRVRLDDPMKRKQLKKGLDQLAEEGAVQVLYELNDNVVEPVLGSMGMLQFEVVQHRLEREYNVRMRYASMSHQYARWVDGDFDPSQVKHSSIKVMKDVEERFILLFETDWARQRLQERFPDLVLHKAVRPGRLKKKGSS